MKWEDFRKRLKEETHQQKIEVDMDSIWNAIEPTVDELNEKKRKRRFFFFWTALLGLLIIGGVVFSFLWKKDIQEIICGEILTQAQVTDSQLVEVERSRKTGLGIEEKIQEQTLKTVTATQKNKTTTSEKNKEKESKKTVKNISSSNFKNKKSEFLSATTNVVVKPKENTVLGKETTPRSSISKEEFLKLEITTAVLSKIETDILKKGTPVNVLFLPKSNLTKVSSENAFSTPFVLEKNDVYHTGNIFKPAEEIVFLESEDQEEIITLEKKEKGKVVFFTKLIGGASYVNRTLSAKNNSARTLLKIRNKYEKNLEASQVGVLVGIAIRDNWKFSVGIQRTQIAEKYLNTESFVEVDSVAGTPIIRINVSGEEVPIDGLVAETTTTLFNKKIYNSYTLIDIPLFIEYHRTLGKWKTGIEAGIFTNLSLQTKGIIPNEILDDINLKTNEEKLFKSKIGWSYQFGLSFQREISKKIDFSFSPSVRFFPSDFSTDENKISQKYYLIGGNIGLRYNF